MSELAEFAQGNKVRFEGCGTIKPESVRWDDQYLKPINTFPRLAYLALQAASRPMTTNHCEGNWSELTQRYLANVRHFSVRFMGMIFRRKDFRQPGMEAMLTSPDFIQLFAAARAFMRKNQVAYKRFFTNDFEDSERKQNAISKKQSHYPTTNIHEPKRKQTVALENIGKQLHHDEN